jgi:hypothetical protein
MPDPMQSLTEFVTGQQRQPGFPEPEMAISHARPIYTDPNTWGRRDLDQSEKGLGYFGPLVTKSGGVMSELSESSTMNGRLVEYPLVVPTLTPDELQHLLMMDPDARVPRSISEKARVFARTRLAAGLSPFAQPGETRVDRYPHLPRAIVQPPDERGILVGKQYLERSQFPPIAVSHPSLINLASLARPQEPR